MPCHSEHFQMADLEARLSAGLTVLALYVANPGLIPCTLCCPEHCQVFPWRPSKHYKCGPGVYQHCRVQAALNCMPSWPRIARSALPPGHLEALKISNKQRKELKAEGWTTQIFIRHSALYLYVSGLPDLFLYKKHMYHFYFF